LLKVLGLLIEALLFGMFTTCMMFDQASVITSKLTHIDRLKGIDVGSSIEGITEVFGCGKRGDDTRFRFDWLSPFSRVCFPESLRDEVMGFCRPVCGGGSVEEDVEMTTTTPSKEGLRPIADII
jgi:hypothetical protein